MVEKKVFEQSETHEPPRVLTHKNVMFWDETSRQLFEEKENGNRQAATLLTKARHFLENDCIEESNGGWNVKPIKGYNTKTYRVFTDSNNDWNCNCQGFVSKLKKGEEPMCSHILAVQQYLKIQGWNK